MDAKTSPGVETPRGGADSAAANCLKAWACFAGDAKRPVALEAIQRSKDGRKGVYRATLDGPQRQRVIAKARGAETFELERVIHEKILCGIEPNCSNYIGSLHQAESGLYWTFFEEEAGGGPYDVTDPAHRALAARWLARLQVATAGSVRGFDLPDRSASFHFKKLAEVDRRIERLLERRPGSREDRETLVRVLSQLRELASLAPDVSGVLDAFPATLVHGDLATKNVGVEVGADGLRLIVFDWAHTAGLGPPAVDLAQRPRSMVRPDLKVYASGVAEAWPEASADSVERLATIGSLFRLIRCVGWASKWLGAAWSERPMGLMRRYDGYLRETLSGLKSA